MRGRPRICPARLSAIAMVSSEPAVSLGARQHRVSAGTTSARVLAGSAEAGPAVRRQTTTRKARILITFARPGGPVRHPRGAIAARVRLAGAGYDLKERSNGDQVLRIDLGKNSCSVLG